MTNIYFAAIEMNGNDQSVLVPANIENDPMIYFVYRRKYIYQFGKAMKLCFLNDLKPACEDSSAIGVFFPKLDKRFTGDDVHE